LFEEKLKEFEPIFYPRSIAVFGASADERKFGFRWAKSLISAGFEGPIYPISPSGGVISGRKIFPNLRSVPGAIDYAIASVPRRVVLEVIDDCIAKKVKAVHFFTGGFSELNYDEGLVAEQEMVRKARQGGLRIIGPNCVGVYCPESKIPCGLSPAGRIGKSGSVGYISQSGGLSEKLAEIGLGRHINYSKGISFGNGIDLDAVDFLQYLAADPKTTIIGAYLEGTRNGRRLFDTMKRVARAKPLVVWKAGRTELGAWAAMSHTGSLASSAAIWSAMLKQAGVIEVHSLEELSDSLLIFQNLGCWKASNVVVVGGVAGGGGGISVSASDTCTSRGLNMPPISSKTREELANLVGEAGTISRNPIDLSQALSRGFSTLIKAIGAVARDPVTELILIQEDVDVFLSYLSWNEAEEMADFLIDLRGRQNKTIVVVLPPGSTEPERLEVEQRLLEASIPVFPTMERAARAIARMSKFPQIAPGER
jgi:acyl-CoA synthetase (NDP forming)